MCYLRERSNGIRLRGFDMCKISKFYRVLMVIIIIVFWMGIVRGEGVNQVITFNNNVQIDGVYGEYTTSFIFNDTISEFEDGKVILYYSVSDLLLHKSSNITFMLNGVKFHTIKISLSGMDKENVVVDIPKRLVNDGYNELQLIALHRTMDGDICLDNINQGNWVVFHKDSYVDIVLDYRDNSYIKDYPYPYIGVNNNVPDTVNIILQEEAGKEELTAYINLCADLGRRDKNEVLEIKFQSKKRRYILIF